MLKLSLVFIFNNKTDFTMFKFRKIVKKFKSLYNVFIWFSFVIGNALEVVK